MELQDLVEDQDEKIRSKSDLSSATLMQSVQITEKIFVQKQILGQQD